jgi:hypothetical protein
MAIDDAFKTQPFPEAVEFLRQKITLDTDGWRDIAGDEADAFFVVAGAKGSLLAEMRSITEQAITEGWRPEQFRERFDQVAAGWDGANPWRADLIYRTNIRQAYARGREEYQFDPGVLSVFPYLKYQHSDALQPRPLHKALDGKIFPAQEIPYTCPNGYNCGCRYTSATEDEAQAQGISTIRRGQTIPTEAGPLPVEPDEGFDRTPGMAKGEERDRIIQRVIDRSPPTIAAQIAAAIAAYVPPDTAPLPDPAEQLATALAAFEDEVIGQSIETAGVFGSDGQLILRKDGGEDYIDFDDDEMALMDGAVLTHNHPLDPRGQGRGVGLSDADIELMVTTGALEIRAVSGDYLYSLRRNQVQDGPEFRDALRRIRNEVNDEVDLWVEAQSGDDDEITSEANFRYWHTVSERLADELGMTYRREARQ